MKVICIDASGIPKQCPDVTFTISEGEVYHVIEAADKKDGYGLCYLLHVDSKYHYWYKHNRFIPLSNINETELVNQQKQVDAI